VRWPFERSGRQGTDSQSIKATYFTHALPAWIAQEVYCCSFVRKEFIVLIFWFFFIKKKEHSKKKNPYSGEGKANKKNLPGFQNLEGLGKLFIQHLRPFPAFAVFPVAFVVGIADYQRQH